MKFKLIAYVMAILGLSACASAPMMPSENNIWQPAKQVDEFNAEGRLAVKVEGKGSYANFDWSYQNHVQTINVNTPLGNTVGQLCEDSQGVLAVDSKGQVYQADNAEELSEQLLGFSLPIQYLHIWMNGHRVDNMPYRILENGQLEQLGWTISRTLNPQGQPRNLLLESSQLTLRLVFSEINNQHDDDASHQCSARNER